jgi:hypothetical protein
VNQAELKIVDSNYKGALACYDKAFKTGGHLFATDLYNASLCAMQLRDSRQAMLLCRELSRRGTGPAFFDRQSVYYGLRRHKDWNKLLEQAARDKQKIMDRYGRVLAIVDSLVAKDQEVNHEWRASGMMKEKRLVMDLTYDTISLHLNRLFDSLGFLSEDKIGAYITDDTTLQPGLPFDVIIIHNYQARMEGDTLFNAILRSALEDKIIKPEYYARLHDFSYNDPGNFFGSAHIYIKYKCTLYREKEPLISYPKLEQARQGIGMPRLADYEKKLRYRLEHPDTRFYIPAPVTVFGSFVDGASEKQFLSKHEVVADKIDGCIMK